MFYYENTLECRNSLHSSQSIIALCTEPYCQKQRLCCSSCLLDNHKDHIDSMIRLPELMKQESSLPIIFNWPKDPIIRSLAIYLRELEKKSNIRDISAIYEPEPTIKEPINIIEDLINDLISCLTMKLNEMKNLLREKITFSAFTAPLNSIKIKQVFEDTFDLRPLKEILENYIKHFSDYHKLEQQLSEFFNRKTLKDNSNFLKNKLENGYSNISVENFEKYKQNLLDQINFKQFHTFILGIPEDNKNSFNNQDNELIYENNFKQSYTNQTLISPTKSIKSPSKFNYSSPFQNDSEKFETMNNFYKSQIFKQNAYKFLGKKNSCSNHHSDWVWSIEILKNTNYFASGGSDKMIRLWDLPTRGCLKTLQKHNDTVRSITYLDEYRLLASCSYDKTIKIWDPFNNFLYSNIQEKTSLNQLKYVNFNRKLASTGEDNIIKIWDIESGGLIQNLIGHTNTIPALYCLSDHKILVSGSWDKSIKFWDLRSKDSFSTLKGHEDWIYALEFMDKHQKLASGGRDGSLKFWDIRVMRCVENNMEFFNLGEKNEKKSIRCISYLGNLNILAFSCGEIIKVRDLNFDESMELKGHTDEVFDLKYSSQTNELISCGKDKNIIVWN